MVSPVSTPGLTPPSLKLVKAVNSCREERRDPLNADRIAANAEKIEQLWKEKLKDAKPGDIVYLRGSKAQLFRSVLGGIENPHIMMTHHEKGGDRLLGKGGYKLVYRCVDLNTQEIKAIAVYRKINVNIEEQVKARRLSRMKQEIKMMEKCKGIEEVVQLHFHKETDDFIFLVMEECPNGDLLSLIEVAQKRCCRILEEKNYINIAVDIARGLEKLHERKIFHRDIKCENIFLFQASDGYHAKVGDLGLACEEADKEARLQEVGSINWFSRKSAQLIVKRIFKKDKEATLAVRTLQDDMDPFGYLLYMLFHPSHSCLPHQVFDEVKASIVATANVSDADLANSLREIPEKYRRVFEGIFFKNWTAKEVRMELEAIQAGVPLPAVSSPAPRTAPHTVTSAHLPVLVSAPSPASAPPAPSAPRGLAAAAAPGPTAAPAPTPDPKLYPLGANPMGMACGPRPAIA